MDRAVSSDIIKKRNTKTWLYAALAIVVVVTAVWLLRKSLYTSVKRAEIRTAVVETGDVENTLQASGVVQPELEQVITSPIAATIQQAHVNAGTSVKAGDRILELDRAFTQLEFEKQKDELALKRNGITKLQLELDKSFYDIKIQDSIKACRITSLKADLENARLLLKAGGGTQATIDKIETELRVAQLEKRQLENDIRSRQLVMQASLRESQITASIQEKELSEFERRLQQANIVAPLAGVLTFVNLNLGTKVSEGEVLARIADLRSYKILGSISDVYAPQLQVGMPVILRVNEELIRGSLVNIRPAVSNNVVSFDVAFDNQQYSAQLRPNQKVDLFLVTDAKPKAVRVANGPALKAGQSQDVFVLLNDGKAQRRRITTGLSNFDFMEIKEGLKTGETVIVSDLSAFKNVTEIKIK
jgi:HlyD family secretion protein